MKTPVSLQKIHLRSFIDILVKVYMEGSDYVDIIAIPDKEQDILSIVAREEYFTGESRHEEDEDIRLSDDLLESLST